MRIDQTARDFFEACETGGGWAACTAYCHDGATFSCQADVLAGTTTLAGYSEWMKDLLGSIPDGRYELTAFTADKDRGTVVASAAICRTTSTSTTPRSV